MVKLLLSLTETCFKRQKINTNVMRPEIFLKFLNGWKKFYDVYQAIQREKIGTQQV